MRWYLPDGNPLFWDELRRRLRDWRWYGLLCGEVVLLGAMLLLCGTDLRSQMTPQAWAKWGGDTSQFLLFGQGLSLIFLIPMLTAGTIIRECEALWLTSLTSWAVVLGKYWATLTILLFTMVAGVPVLALPLFLGRISLWGFLDGELLIMAAVAMFTTLGMLAACECKRMSEAIPTTYLFMLGTVICYLIIFIPVCLMASHAVAMAIFISFSLIHCFFALRTSVLALEKRRFERSDVKVSG